MRFFLNILFAGLLVFFSAIALAAQENENSFLINLIEEKLSSPNRIVRLIGVEGALSSEANIAEITIADKQGVWLRIVDARINWKRSALLRGLLEVENLSAALIEIPRGPVPDDGLPTPEATGFALPELPIEIGIAHIEAAEISIGAELLGIEAILHTTAAFQLNDAGLYFEFDAQRLNGVGGSARARVEYRRSDQFLDLDILITEPKNGVIANTLGIEGTPPLMAKIVGSGPVSDIAVALSVDANANRLIAGALDLNQQPEGLGFDAYLAGEIGPLLPSTYRQFFEGESRILLSGMLRDSGGLSIPKLEISTADMTLTGKIETLADGFPSTIVLNAAIARQDGARVVLPFAQGSAGFSKATLDITFGQAVEGSWRLGFAANDFASSDFSAKNIVGQFNGSAKQLDNPDQREISGEGSITASGMDASEESVARALGKTLVANAGFDWHASEPLNLHRIAINTDNMVADAQGKISGLDFVGRLSAKIDDLAVFAQILNTDISGAVTFESNGKINALDGTIDLEIRADGRDIQIGDPRIDPLLAGFSKVRGGLRRDETGLAIQGLKIETNQMKATGSAILDSKNLQFELQADIDETSHLVPELLGAASLRANGKGAISDLPFTASIVLQNGISADVSGRFGDTLDIRARINELPLPALNPFYPQMALAGTASGEITVTGQLDELAFGFDLLGRNIDTAYLEPYATGPLQVAINGAWAKNDLTLGSMNITGARGLEFNGSGTVSGGGSVLDLQLDGKAPLALAAQPLAKVGIAATGQATLNIGVSGSLAKPNIVGPFQISGGTVIIPKSNLHLEGIEIDTTFSGQTLNISSAVGDFAGGGSIAAQGQVGFGPGFPVNLAINIAGANYTDSKMFTTTLDGQLQVIGTLVNAFKLSGDIALGVTEVQIPSDFGSVSELADVNHIRPSRPVLRSLERAGLTASGNGVAQSAGPLELDISIDSPQRIFVRGRGVDAELGGTVRVLGSAGAFRGVGQFDLIRGRMDFLGRRINFTEGKITLSGNLEPQIDFIARTNVDDLEISVRLTGAITSPELRLSSAPALPEDEILARLIFSRGFSDLSLFQIAQLAGAVAELSGRSGTGLAETLRRAAGLDNLDIRTLETGETSIAAGKYLDEGFYTEVELASDGKANLSINLDILDDITARGSVGSDGSTSLGVFFEKDY